MPFTADQKRVFEEAYHKACETTVDSKLVGLTDLMLKVMKEGGLADEQYLHPSRIVPHNLNRGGADMEYRKMFEKTSKILGVGFSFPKCDPSRAVCFQRKPGSKLKFIPQANACPFFANFVDCKVDGQSVGCGHLNQGLAAIDQGIDVPPEFHKDEDICGTNGDTKLSKHDICAKDAEMTKSNALEQAINVGLKWTYIYSSAEEAYPRLPDIMQKALNVEHHIGEGESWHEQFGAIARSIIRHYQSGGTKAPDSKKLCRQALASKPPRSCDVMSHVEFCKKWGGGPVQELALEICKYVQNKGNSNLVTSTTFEALNKLQVPIDANITEFTAALVKYAATIGTARKGESISPSVADIKSIVLDKRMVSVKTACEFIRRAKDITASMPEHDGARGDMECVMVDYILEKLPKDQRESMSLNSIVEDFISKVGAPPAVQDPPELPADSETNAEYMFDPTENVASQTLSNLGWHVGAIVTLKKGADPKKPKADVQY